MARFYVGRAFPIPRWRLVMYLQAQSIWEAAMDLGRTALRFVIGPLFVGHGTQKLFGWFGGHGPDGTGAFFEQLGLKPGKRHATAAGASETVGGALLTLGALTPVAAGLITGTMITAIRKVHAPKGPWATDGGYEYNLTLIAAMLALTETGPGRPSVDAAVFPSLKGNGLALAAVRRRRRRRRAAHLRALERRRPPAQADDVEAPRRERFTREESEVPDRRQGTALHTSGREVARWDAARRAQILVPSCATDRTPAPGTPAHSRPCSRDARPRGSAPSARPTS